MRLPLSRRFRPLLAGSALVLVLAGCVPQRPGLDFAPDGKQLVVPWGARHTLYRVSANGKSAQPLPGKPVGEWTRWSPDGSRLAYLGEKGIFVHDLAARRSRLLVKDEQPPLAWSADGQELLAFHSDSEGRWEARWHDAADGTVRLTVPLTTHRVATDAPLALLPGDHRVVLTAEDSTGRNLYLLEGEQVSPLTRSGDVIGLGLADEGQRLVWARKALQLPRVGMTLFAMDLAERRAVRLPFAALLGPAKTPRRQPPVEIDYVAFSPGARRLAIPASRPDGITVFTTRLDGSELHAVKHLDLLRPRRSRRGPEPDDPRFWSLFPYWSPDGRLAVLASAKRSTLSLFSPEGTGETRLPLPASK